MTNNPKAIKNPVKLGFLEAVCTFVLESNPRPKAII